MSIFSHRKPRRPNIGNKKKLCKKCKTKRCSNCGRKIKNKC